MPSKIMYTAAISGFLLAFAPASHADIGGVGVDVSADIGGGDVSASASASVGSSASASASVSTSHSHDGKNSKGKKHSGFKWPWQKAKQAAVPAVTKKVGGVVKHVHKDLHGIGHGRGHDHGDKTTTTNDGPVARVTRDESAIDIIRPLNGWDRSKVGMPIYSSDGHLLGTTNAVQSGKSQSMLVHAKIARDLGISHSEVMLRMASFNIRNDRIVFNMTRDRFVKHMSKT